MLLWGAVLASLPLGACQDYEYVFQPYTRREGTHLRFDVQQPSKADLLFVIDNTPTMSTKQEALKASIGEMLTLLAPQDTAYRIGIVSADARGSAVDCCLQPIVSPNPDEQFGGDGNCQRCDCVTDGTNDCNGDGDCLAPQTCDLTATPTDPGAFDGVCFGKKCSDCAVCTQQVLLNRPHDGARGRLIAAYDPDIFQIDAVDGFGNPLYPDTLIPTSLAPILVGMFPTSPDPELQVPWVIDREEIRQRACVACGCAEDGCSPTAEDTVCFDECAQPISQALVAAYFNSNVNGLGTSGTAYEEGIKSAMYAVGINPLAGSPQQALDPGSLLTAEETLGTPPGANTWEQEDALGVRRFRSWLREDAALALMFVTDEDDCSMTDILWEHRFLYEQGAGLPAASVCYQSTLDGNFLDAQTMFDLLLLLKGSASRLTMGFIGGARQAGGPGRERRAAAPIDCISEPLLATEAPNEDCACRQVSGEGTTTELDWCPFSIISDPNVETPPLPFCDTVAGGRYIDLARLFRRRSFDSICRSCDPAASSCEAFGEALKDFARLATLACFQLDELRPAGCSDFDLSLCDPALIQVEHATRAQVDDGIDPTLMAMVDPETTTPPEEGGWFYDASENQICLLGIDRAIGDVYDVFVLHTDELDFTP